MKKNLSILVVILLWSGVAYASESTKDAISGVSPIDLKNSEILYIVDATQNVCEKTVDNFGSLFGKKINDPVRLIKETFPNGTIVKGIIGVGSVAFHTNGEHDVVITFFDTQERCEASLPLFRKHNPLKSRDMHTK